MYKWQKKRFWFGLLSAIFLGTLWFLFPIGDATVRLNSLPLVGEDFQGHNVSLSPFEQKLFEGITVVKRLYAIDGTNYSLTVIDGTHNRHMVNDPYYCFRGSGWTLLGKTTIPIEKGKALLMTLSKEGVKKEAIYWFTDGSHHFVSPIRYWWEATLRRLSFGLSGEEPILIVLQPLTDSPVDWNALLNTFPPILNI